MGMEEEEPWFPITGLVCIGTAAGKTSEVSKNSLDLGEVSSLAPSGDQEREQAGCKRLASLQASNGYSPKEREKSPLAIGGLDL